MTIRELLNDILDMSAWMIPVFMFGWWLGKLAYYALKAWLT